MYRKYLSLFLAFLIVPSPEATFSSRFYEGSKEHKFDCSFQFDSQKVLDCACIDGLWRLYETECQESMIVGGDKQFCFPLKHNVTRAEMILPDRKSLSVVKEGVIIPLLSSKLPIKGTKDDEMYAGDEWTLSDDDGNSICLATHPNSYCVFKVDDFGLSQITHAKEGCAMDMLSVLPRNCFTMYSESKDICRHRVMKREVPKNRQMGRTIFGGPGQNAKIFNGSLINNTYDEDYLNETLLIIPEDSFASEVFNFMDARLNEILDIKEPTRDFIMEDSQIMPVEDKPKIFFDRTFIDLNEDIQIKPLSRPKRAVSKQGGRKITPGSNKAAPTITNIKTVLTTNRSPVYQLLDLSKEVMQKTCPDFYVTPEFFDLAVSAFIKVQQKFYKFPEGDTAYYGYGRIIESLQECVKNMATFNFTKDLCKSRDMPVSGAYCAFGKCDLEININSGYEKFEPMVETVWNVFVTAHSSCFSYFNRASNDHHRFTTWMLPLFQTQINDIWKAGTSRGIVYGGLLGNAEYRMAAVTYCTAAQQMLSDYPWALPRPNKVDDLASLAIFRKKRSVYDRDSLSSGECSVPQRTPNCGITKLT